MIILRVYEAQMRCQTKCIADNTQSIHQISDNHTRLANKLARHKIKKA